MTTGYFRLGGWRGAIGSFVLWAIYFVVVYAYLSIGCEKGWSEAELFGLKVLTLALAAITLAAMGAIAALAWMGFRRWRTAANSNSDEGSINESQDRFTGLLTVMTSGLALLATIWVGLPVLLLQPCQ